MPIRRDDLAGTTFADGDVVDTDGNKIGGIGQIYCDDNTGEPAWVTARTGLFGTSESFVPLEGASLSDGNIVVGYDKDIVKNAPRIDDDGSLSEDDEQALYDYYRVGGTTTDPDPAYAGTADVETTRSNPDPYDADRDDTGDRDPSGAVTEERLDAGTAPERSGRTRLRKYVVTEEVTLTVPVRREEIRVEGEPADDDTSDSVIVEEGDEDQVTLYEERPVVQMETVPVERLRVDTDVDVDGTATRPN